MINIKALNLKKYPIYIHIAPNFVLFAMLLPVFMSGLGYILDRLIYGNTTFTLSDNVYDPIIISIGLLFSMFIHEFGHAISARAIGIYQVKDMVFIGIAAFVSMDIGRDLTDKEDIITSFCGPLANLMFAAVLFLLSSHLGYMCKILVFMNVFLFVGNLIPFTSRGAPTDGRRVLEAIKSIRRRSKA